MYSDARGRARACCVAGGVCMSAPPLHGSLTVIVSRLVQTGPVSMRVNVGLTACVRRCEKASILRSHVSVCQQESLCVAMLVCVLCDVCVVLRVVVCLSAPPLLGSLSERVLSRLDGSGVRAF